MAGRILVTAACPWCRRPLAPFVCSVLSPEAFCSADPSCPLQFVQIPLSDDDYRWVRA